MRTLAVLLTMARRIQGQESELLERQSNRVSVHRLTYRGMDVDVVYDKKRNTIVTFLPPEAG